MPISTERAASLPHPMMRQTISADRDAKNLPHVHRLPSVSIEARRGYGAPAAAIAKITAPVRGRAPAAGPLNV